MKGIELTQESGKMVYISLNSITSVSPYMGFDGKESGTRIDFSNQSIRVTEDYVTVVEGVMDQPHWG